MKRSVLIVLVLFIAGCAGRYIEHSPGHPKANLVAAILGDVLVKNGYPATEIKYMVWKNDEVNAFLGRNNDGQYGIVYTTGFLYRLPSEIHSVLYAVTAHEVAHYRLGHIQKKIAVNAATDISVGVGLFVVGLVTGLPVGLAGNAITPAITSAYSRSQELDADAEAVNLLRGAGALRPKEVYADALRWLKQSSPEKSWHLWSTHPPIDDRIQAVLQP